MREKMRCGSCGNTSHEIFQCKDKTLIIKCESCDNESRIVVTAPALKIDWIDGNEGIIAVF